VMEKSSCQRNKWWFFRY